MFAIGDRDWPGISKLVEESGEVLQVCGKLIATAGEVAYYDGSNLRDDLQDELGDQLAAIEFVIQKCGLDYQRIQARAATKLRKFREWHREQLARGGG